jgi:hypothetical protein
MFYVRLGERQENLRGEPLAFSFNIGPQNICHYKLENLKLNDHNFHLNLRYSHGFKRKKGSRRPNLENLQNDMYHLIHKGALELYDMICLSIKSFLYKESYIFNIEPNIYGWQLVVFLWKPRADQHHPKRITEGPLGLTTSMLVKIWGGSPTPFKLL